MLRELQVTKDKPANSMLKSGEVKIMTGMGVVKDDKNGTFVFPAEVTATDIFFVDKERIPKGTNAGLVNMSDYHEDFTVLEEGEFGKVIAYYAGERIATDQFDTALDDESIGKRVAIGKDGIVTLATVPSKYIFKGLYDDAGHTLAIIEVGDVATNA